MRSVWLGTLDGGVFRAGSFLASVPSPLALRFLFRLAAEVVDPAKSFGLRESGKDLAFDEEKPAKSS